MAVRRQRLQVGRGFSPDAEQEEGCDPIQFSSRNSICTVVDVVVEVGVDANVSS